MSIFRRFTGGAESVLGGFGRGILKAAQRVGQSVSDAISRIARTGAQPEPLTVAREWGQVRLEGERQATVGALDIGQAIPRALYTERSVKYGDKFAYTVAIYGRDLATGRFARQELDVWVSREHTPEEILDEASINVDKAGGSPLYDIYSITLVGASIRAGDYWD